MKSKGMFTFVLTVKHLCSVPIYGRKVKWKILNSIVIVIFQWEILGVRVCASCSTNHQSSMPNAQTWILINWTDSILKWFFPNGNKKRTNESLSKMVTLRTWRAYKKSRERKISTSWQPPIPAPKYSSWFNKRIEHDRTYNTYFRFVDLIKSISNKKKKKICHCFCWMNEQADIILSFMHYCQI